MSFEETAAATGGMETTGHPFVLKRIKEVLWALAVAGLVVGIGRFAEYRARDALAGLDVEIGNLLHPSPANPRANRGWAEEAERQLGALGLLD